MLSGKNRSCAAGTQEEYIRDSRNVTCDVARSIANVAYAAFSSSLSFEFGPDVRGKCRLQPSERGMKGLVGSDGCSLGPVTGLARPGPSLPARDFTFRVPTYIFRVPRSFPRTGERRLFLWVVRKRFRCCRNIVQATRGFFPSRIDRYAP